jgi:hypothetical protein
VPAAVPGTEENSPAAPVDDMADEAPAEEKLAPAANAVAAPRKAPGKRPRKTAAAAPAAAPASKKTPVAPAAAPASKKTPVAPAAAPAPPAVTSGKPASAPAKE